MIDPLVLTMDRAAAVLLLLGNAILFPGLMMFWIRGGQRGGAPPTRAYYVWERAFVMVAVVPTALGFLLLQAGLQNTGGHIVALVGAVVYLGAAALAVYAETLHVREDYRKAYPIVVVYVVLAFLAQAAIGAALLQSGLLAPWIGWLGIVWNLAWLVLLPLLTPRDIYFPVLHHVLPLVLGVGLLMSIP